DLALVDGPTRAPEPWVHVPDADAAVDDLRERVSRSPLAAVTLVQVLRAGAERGFDDALVIESLAYSMLQAGPEFERWLAARPAPRPRPAEARVLSAERRGDELDVVLDRPQVRNAMNAALRDALCEVLEVAVVDDGIDRVRLSGRGPDFCSGGDLDEFGTSPDPATAHRIRTSRAPASLVAAMAGRVEVELHGACVGAGIEIAAAAGRVIAAPDTRLRLPELGMGLIPGAGGTASLPRRIGRHRTAWLALSGVWLGAGTAIDWGLVDEVVTG
ncbi:MAG: enoyl-CoA hydratase/isomerase family protein, partial [Acidimicrobiales bacterium]|nr:enoyl-CoA hydratase/isomerase family protein [Acidimicrobiales bacterium]